MPAPVLPAWCEELRTGLSFASQFALSGNVRDLYPLPKSNTLRYVALEPAIRAILRGRGIEAMLVHDPVDGLRLSGPHNPETERYLSRQGFQIGETASTADAMATLIRRVTALREMSLALVIDYAEQTLAGFGAERALVEVEADKAARARLGKRPKGASKAPFGNPIFWIGSVSPSSGIGSEDGAVREIPVDRPTLEVRLRYAQTLAEHFPEAETANADDTIRHLERFALLTDGESLVTMRAIAQLARSEGLRLDALETAIRTYRTGQRKNPWTSPFLRSRMASARQALADRVKGQDHAIDKTVDILLRSITGLSGSQSSGGLTRPRGVLFFAGPTGVGKTELAKAVTELLFGDEGACHRFDMSEFMAEDSVARLIGSPQGRDGPAQTGELTAALRERPFSVFLFDEIEKAHPRILDTFLQVLDEGRITDASGVTAHFSEALIIFTSNIGMFGGAKSMNMGMNILPSDPYDALDRKIHEAVQDHFRYDLQRPELINRLGQNVVSFDFIHPLSERAIFEATITRVCDKVLAEHGLEVTLTSSARSVLQDICTRDVFDGGRGIGNRVETHFVNPLARQIFEQPGRSTLTVREVVMIDGRSVLAVE
jgi:ATP-dependent Clp protease ATP-binding subunit ClpA